MVALPMHLGYCIDSTEVTQGQYKAWLDSGPYVASQSGICLSTNNSFTPTTTWPPTAATLNLPVVGVDWCDAFRYCAAAGKRLCGNIAGGSNGYNNYNDPTQSQWYAACTSNGAITAHGYPYSNTYSGSTCNGVD